VNRLFSWQWMWGSRPRLLAVAAGTLAFGGLAILYAVTRPQPWNKPVFMIIFGGLTVIGYGGYQMLQGLFSPAGAFGDATDRDANY
jgi:hypothetical protein